MRKNIFVVIVSVFISIPVFSQINKNAGIWIIDYVKIKPGKEKEALYFYEQNWLVFREAAKKEGFIKSYQLINLKKQTNALFDLMLMTEFADSIQHKAMEENFLGVMRKVRPGGALFLNELRPKEFMEFANSAEAVNISNANGQEK